MTYHWLDGVERLGAYKPGGLHPIIIGDELDQGRYHVVHKLGYGSYSTVWLARDTTANRHVALKVLSADSSKHSTELEVLKSLNSSLAKQPERGRRFISSFYGDFLITGPNGQHRCLVSEVLGPSVHGVKETYTCDLLPIDVARKTTVQLALGLAGIHASGIVHGDIHVRNIAYKLPSIDSWSVEQVYQRFGQPSKQTVARVDGKPIGPEAPPYAVRPAVTLRAVDPSAAEISIIDFGEASFSSTPRTTWHTPLLLQAPEALLGESVGQPADMWAFACTVFALFGNSVPFECGMPDSDDVLAEIVDGLGPLPQRWWDKWELRPEFYDYSGAKKTDLLPKEYWPVKPLAERIRQIRSSPPAARDAEQLGAEDVLGLRTLLESCLRYDPAERATAEDVLELAWIQKLRKAYASTNDHA